MQLISRVEGAKLLGVTKEAVYQAIKRNRITTYPDKKGVPMLDADTLVKEWNRNTQRPVSVKVPDKPPANIKSEPRMSRTQEYIPDYDESRARTEHLKAELLEIDRQQKQGKLVPAEDVEAKWLENYYDGSRQDAGDPKQGKATHP